jgi:glycosyltransferase involved in cell wall biosynthesis
MRKLSVIVPIYNEEKTLVEILNRVLSLKIPNWEIEVVAVDDASTDLTPSILKSFGDKIITFRNASNQGKGTTVRAGLMRATGEYMVIQDADLEYDPKEIGELIKLLVDDKTIVYGSRNLHSTKRRGFFVQRYGTHFTTWLINLLYGVHLTDVWTCYKIFPAASKNLYVPGKFESDIIFLLGTIRSGYRIVEGPISHAPRNVNEGKKIRYRDGLWAVILVILDRLAHIKKIKSYQAKDVSNIIVDPRFLQPLKKQGTFLISKTGEQYKIDEEGRPYLMSDSLVMKYTEEHEGGINWLKSFFKQFPGLYYSIWHFACPVLMLVNGPKRIKNYAKSNSVILDVGSGPERLDPDFINVDIYPFPEVDIVADAAKLPFRDNSIDGVVSESVLEHVADPLIVAAELKRILKPGGYIYVSAPFIHPYHASPDDFNRWTISGLKHLFKELEVVESGVRSGPFSALLMFLVYWLGVIFSFGFKKFAPFITHFLMVFVGPLKFFDFLFYWIPGSEAVSTHLYVIAIKRS